jgi:phosphoribosyl 1,2-cyclic phosphate phosphodiesterase
MTLSVIPQWRALLMRIRGTMELLILGTAAAEGWPAPFCLCDHCEEARRRGGVNIRGRAGALIDDDLKIDFGPDTLSQMQRTGRNLAHVKTILFTHQHSDHVAASELHWMVPTFTRTPPGQVEVWGNEATLTKIRDGVALPRVMESLDLHAIKGGDAFTTWQGDEVLAMPADHVEGAMVFRIKRGGKTIFYGNDSGLYPQPTLESLADGTELDIALFDCTSGGQETSNRNHMAVSGVIQMAGHLRKVGAITDKTRAVATHFSHNGGILHEELVQRFLPHRIEVAFDGMVIKV